MIKKTMTLLLLLASTSLWAEEVSDQCLLAMQNVYKFYYHQIQPGGQAPEQKLGEAELAQMQAAIGELKTNCSPQLVSKMNLFLQKENSTG